MCGILQDAAVSERYTTRPCRTIDRDPLKPSPTPWPGDAGASRPRSYSFLKAAAIRQTVHLLCAAVRRLFSFGRPASAQVDARLTPAERLIASAALEDAGRRDQPGCPDDHHAAGFQCLPWKGACAAASMEVPDLSDWRVRCI